MTVMVAVPDSPEGVAALAAAVAEAEHLGTDLVGKALLGSVSQGLLLDAPIPVLAVKVDKGSS